MKAVQIKQFGTPDVLYIGEMPTPTPRAGDVLVRVRATALNRADLLQRRGLYPPPPGATEVLGLEMAGEVVRLGEGVTGYAEGDRVCALLPGGGYAEYVTVPAGLLMRLPDNLTFAQGAAIPEAFLTAYLNLFVLGALAPGKTVLVHAGASGVGTSAIQLIKKAEAVSYVTAGTPTKLERCYALGAEAGWNYNDGSFEPFIQEETDGEGVDIILDFIGAPYFTQNVNSLAVDGRLLLIGMMGGSAVENIQLGQLLAKRLQIIGTALRSRSLSDKIQLTAGLVAFVGDSFTTGKMAPVLDSVFDWREVAQAHRHMEANKNIGKIVLNVGA